MAVTGGAGFIGTHTVELLVAAGAKVLVIDDHSHPCGEPLPKEVDVVSVDCGSEAAAKALATFKPDVVLHLASKGGVQKAARAPGDHVKMSLASTVALYDAAIKAGAGRIITASSGGTIYGEGAKLPAREIHKPAPLSAYGAAKRSEEVYMAALGLRHGIATLAMRYGNVRRVCLNPTRAHRDLGWKSKVSINTGLEKTWAWFRKRHSAQRAATLGMP